MDNKEIATQDETIKEVIDELEKFQLSVPVPVVSITDLKNKLSNLLNNLITTDFSRLIAILYRLDISEKRLKQLLQNEMSTPAGDIIAEMIIVRQGEKIKTRKLIVN